MQLDQVVVAIKRRAGCEVFGCVIVAQIIRSELVILHRAGNTNYDHAIRFDMLKHMWEDQLLNEAATIVREDHVLVVP